MIMKTFVRDDYLKLGAPKTFADGSLSADTAAIWHTWPEDTRGNLRVPMWKLEELQKFRIDSWLRRVGNCRLQTPSNSRSCGILSYFPCRFKLCARGSLR